MKNLNLIFIATALILSTACTDTEQVLPTDFSQEEILLRDMTEVSSGSVGLEEELTLERAPFFV